MSAKTHIVKIGNSGGIRIPKALLDEADLPEADTAHRQLCGTSTEDLLWYLEPAVGLEPTAC